MQPAPIPDNEKERLASVRKLGLLDTSPEARFDRITKIATRIFHVPISTLTLIDSKREWFKSCQGVNKREGDRAISFCGHALVVNTMLVILDTKKDKRFMDNPMVTGKPYIRFYAGIPISSADGARIGVFCIKDIKPREFTKDDEEILKGLALWAEIEINSHNLSLALTTEKKLEMVLRVQRQKLERLIASQQESKKALLNVMEDLETTHKLMEFEKAKDEAMLDSIGEGLIAVDTNGKISLINKATEEIMGWKTKELIGKGISELMLEDEAGHMIPLDKRPTHVALITGKMVTNTFFFVRKNKTRFPIAIVVTPIKLKGKTIGAIVIFRDITHEKEIDRAKSEFVSLASHQLRTPLGIMKWYLEALNNDDYFNKAPIETRKYFDQIYKSNERVLSLVRDLLSVSRIEQGRVNNVEKSVDIIQQITEIVDQMQIIAHKKKVTLHVTIQKKNIPNIRIDPLRFHEVIENLLCNAINYSLDMGSVDVMVDVINGVLEVQIHDKGIGIAEEDRGKLFTKFFRSEKAIKHNPEGSGLGLYVVKSYVEGWGGKIAATSIEGKGSTFILSLPISHRETVGKGAIPISSDS